MVNEPTDGEFSADELSLPPTSMTSPRRGKKLTEVAAKSGTKSTAGATAKNGQSKRSASPAPNLSEGRPKRMKPTPTARKVTAQPAIKLKAPRRVKEDIFNEPEHLFSSTRSLLYHQETNITGILYHPETIEELSTSELGWQFCDVKKSDVRHAVEHFKYEGSRGQYSEVWLENAITAGKARANGDFDEMINEKFKEDWGCESGEEYEGWEETEWLPKPQENIDSFHASEERVPNGTSELHGHQNEDEQFAGNDYGLSPESITEDEGDSQDEGDAELSENEKTANDKPTQTEQVDVTQQASNNTSEETKDLRDDNAELNTTQQATDKASCETEDLGCENKEVHVRQQTPDKPSHETKDLEGEEGKVEANSTEKIDFPKPEGCNDNLLGDVAVTEVSRHRRQD